MKNSYAFAAAATLLLFSSAGLPAQPPPDPSDVSIGAIAKDFDKPLNAWLHMPGWIKLEGQYRGRFEDDTALKFVPGANDAFYLQRVRFRMTIAPTKWLRMIAELMDNRNYLYGNRALAGYTSDPIDLRQAFVEIGNPEGTGFDVKVGRQDIVFGNGRMLSDFDATNNGLYHDLIRATYNEPGWNLNVMGGSRVSNNNTNAFDEHIPGEHWYGAYLTLKSILPGMTIEPYYLIKTNYVEKGERGTGSAAVDALATRIAGVAPGGIDYSAEVVKETGHYATDRVSALGGAYVAGWTIARNSWKPRLSVEYSHASGDHNPKDGTRQTFDTFYGGRTYFGMTDQVGWKNIRTTRIGFDFAASKRVKFRVDVRNHNLASTQDGLYTVGSALSFLDRNATSTHVGVEWDNTVEFIVSKQMNVKAGFVHIFPGQFLLEASKGSSYSSPYVMWTKYF